MSASITPARARRVSRRWPLISGGVAVLLALGLGLMVVVRTVPGGADVSFLGELVEHRSHSGQSRHWR